MSYVSIAEYQIPSAAEANQLSKLRTNGEWAALATEIASMGRVPGSAIETAMSEGDLRGALMLLRAPSIDWRLCAPWITVVRTRSSETLRFAMSQPALVELVTRGYVIREAVACGFHEAVQRILELPSVDPNAGGPLHKCALEGDLVSLKLLCAHPRVAVNAFTPARGTTALCQAVITGSEDIFCYLLAHPRIDVNRGFLYTPLQLCVVENRVSFARLLLSRPAVLVNKASGATLPPLWLALECEHREIAVLLLKDSRVFVGDALVDRLEEQGDCDALQLIADSEGSPRWGSLWKRRASLCFAVVGVEWAAGICDLICIGFAGRLGLPTYAVLLLLVHVIVEWIGTALVVRRPENRPWGFIRAIPFLPLLETACTARMARSKSLSDRATSFRTLQRIAVMLLVRAALGFAIHIGYFHKSLNYRVLPVFVVIACVLSLIASGLSVRIRKAQVATGASGYSRLG